MHFLKTTTSIPVPCIYALFQDQDTKRNYIIMEHIHGVTLEKAWPGLSEMEKEAIAFQLRLVVQKMSLLSSPDGFCTYGRRALTDGIFWTPEGKPASAGPFESEKDFNNAIITIYLQQGFSRHKADYYRRVFDALFNEHNPSFTHGDFQRKNILVKTGADGVSEPEIVIIDWEFSGWYPSYWEYCKAIYGCGRWSDDWSDWLHQILEPSFAECGWVLAMLREIWA
jgi:thiamine kinase-like enzyme